MNTPLESVRADVKFALTKQPGEEHAALDGDGHTIYKLSFLFTGGSPPPAPTGGCGTDPTPDGLDCLFPTVGC